MILSQETRALFFDNTQVVGCEDILDNVSQLALFVGGTRSGKTDLATSWLGQFGQDATYVATLGSGEGDQERVAKHRARRPTWMDTLELKNGNQLLELLEVAQKPMLVDSLGTWLVRFDDFAAPTAQLLELLGSAKVPIAVVAELVGEGIHPVESTSRKFVDVLGEVTQDVRRICSVGYLVVAGTTLVLPEPQWNRRD